MITASRGQQRCVKRITSSVYFRFTALFAAAFLLSALSLIASNKGYIWQDDGLEQQYTFFLLEGKWLRELFSSFLSGSPSIPMWSNEIGYGADYFVSVMNTIGNPINLISVFANPYNGDVLLNLTVPLTLYLAGISFLRYVNYKQFDEFYSVLGALVYVFNAYALLVYTQIFMLYVMVLGPYVLLGADRIFDRRQPFSFIFGVFQVTILGVSQIYMFAILLFVYCLIRYIFLDEAKSILSFVCWVAKFIGAGVLGVLLGSAFFLPVAFSVLSQDRLSLERPSDLLYSLGYYSELYRGLASAKSVGSECFVGIAPTGILALFSTFCLGKYKVAKEIRCILLCFVIMLCLPFIGRLMNGMAYPSNRWAWAFGLLGGVAIASCIPMLIMEGNLSKRARLLMPVFVYASIGLLIAFPLLSNNAVFFYSVATLGLLLFSLICFSGKQLGRLFMFATCISVGYLFYQWGAGVKAIHVDFGGSYEAMESSDPGAEMVKEQEDSDEWHYDSSFTSKRNSNIAFGLLGSSFYNSFYNGNIDAYHSSLGLVTSPYNFTYMGFNSRLVMEAFGGVKYYISNSESNGEVTNLPAQFDRAVSSTEINGKEYSLYSTSHALPVAFLVDSVISLEEYEELTMVERQEALTEAVVLEEADADRVFDASSVSEHPFTIAGWAIGDGGVVEETDSASFDGSSFIVTEPNTKVMLSVELPSTADSEAYVSFFGLNYSDISNGQNSDGGFFTVLSNYAKGVSEGGVRNINIGIEVCGQSYTLWAPTGYHDLYGGKEDWCYKLPKGNNHVTIELTFPVAGTYSFDEIRIESMSTDSIIQNIDALSSTPVRDQVFSTNGFSCSATVEHETNLVLRIPYSEGWSAFVDGKRVDIEKADLAFMSIRLSEGEHSIVLSYETPFLSLGSCISLVRAAACCIGMVLYCRHRK